jgi:hypothetical protein
MEYELIGNIENGIVYAGQSENGMVFKSKETYLYYPDEICYVPEYGFSKWSTFEWGEGCKGSVDDVKGYTHNDLLKLCDGNEKLCDVMFDLLDWQFPETWLEGEDDEY